MVSFSDLRAKTRVVKTAVTAVAGASPVAFRTAKAAVAALAVAASAATAQAQVLPINETTTVGLLGASAAGPHWSVVNEYKAVQNTPKVQNLVAFARKTLGNNGMNAYPEAGIQVRYLVRFSRNGLYGDMWVRTGIVPLTGAGKNGETAAIVWSYFESTPQLVVPRLLVRHDRRNWHVTEYAFDKTNRMVEIAAVKGHAIVRSPLKLLEAKNPAAHRSLRARLDQTATQPVANSLIAVYDPRQTPVGQGEMLLSTAVFTSAVAEVEYQAGYVSGTIENAKDLRFDGNALMNQVKDFLKDALKKIAQELAKAFLQWLKSYFGF